MPNPPMAVEILDNRFILYKAHKCKHIFWGLDERESGEFSFLEVIIKIRQYRFTNKRLKHEIKVYNALENAEGYIALRKDYQVGFPSIVFQNFCKYRQYHYFVMTNEGESLAKLHSERRYQGSSGKGFGKIMLCKIAIKGIQILKFLHSVGYIHRNVDPYNFLYKDGIISLIDFRSSFKFLDLNGNRILEQDPQPCGSNRSICTADVEKRTYRPKDDLEALGYMIVNLGRRLLPWQTNQYFKSSTEERKNFMIKKHVLKNITKIPKERYPKPLKSFILWARSNLDERLDYNFWYDEFRNELERLGTTED